MNQFNEIYLQEPIPVSAAYDLAKEYHERCEAYDETVCSGRNERERCAWPIGYNELCLVNMNARRVLDEVKNKAISLGIDPKDLRLAIANYLR